VFTYTYSAVILSFVAAFALLRAGSNRAWLVLVPPCVLVRLLLNLMDGLIARESGAADVWGEVKNEFGDRVADVAIFLGLGFGGYADTRLAALALALILLCVSHVGTLGKAVGGSRVHGGVFGKGDRMISLAVFSLYPLLSGDLTSYNWYLVWVQLLSVTCEKFIPITAAFWVNSHRYLEQNALFRRILGRFVREISAKSSIGTHSP